MHEGRKLAEFRAQGDRVIIGSSPEATIRLKDSYVSGTHCAVEIKNNQVFIEDQGSKNGTMVNGRRVQYVELLHGDNIQIGRCEVQVHFLNGLSPSSQLLRQAQQQHQSIMEVDNEKTVYDFDVEKMTKKVEQPTPHSTPHKEKLLPHPKYRQQEIKEENRVEVADERAEESVGESAPEQLVAYDPNSFDLNEEDEYDREFTAPFSLVKSLVRPAKSDAVRRTERVLEVLEFAQDTVLGCTNLESGATYTVRGLASKRKLVKAESQGFKLRFSPDDEGFVIINEKRQTLQSLMGSSQVSSHRDGSASIHLGYEDIACVRIDDKKYYLRYTEKQHVPRARFSLKLSREMSKMIGLSCLTHVLAIVIVAFISARGNAALEKVEEERFVKVDVEDLKEKPPEPPKPKVAEPKPTPVPTPVVKVAPKPEPKPKVVVKPKPLPQPKLAVKLPTPPKVIPPKVVVLQPPKPKPVPAAPVPQPPNIEKAGVLGALAGIGSPLKQQNKLVSAITNLHAVQARGGVQTFSVSGLQGKIDTNDVIIQRIGDVNTKGASGVGQRNYGVAMVSNKKGDGGNVTGLVFGEDSVTRPTIKGGLSREEIAKVVRQHVAEINYCYEKGLIADASLTGKMNVLWNIGADGRVTITRIINSELRNGQVHSCITGNIRTWEFPKPTGGNIVEVTYPFLFSNAGY
jgi:outer membrane biosynthesis protein TonB